MSLQKYRLDDVISDLVFIIYFLQIINVVRLINLIIFLNSRLINYEHVNNGWFLFEKLNFLSPQDTR